MKDEESKAEESRQVSPLLLAMLESAKAENAAGDKGFLAVPSVAIDYNYWSSERGLVS